MYITIIVVLMLLLSPFIYKAWIGKTVSVPFIVSVFMAVNVILLTWITVHSQLLNGLGKIKLQLYYAIFGLIVNIPVSFYLGTKFGIIGVIGASILVNLIGAIWPPIQISLLLNKKAVGIWNK